MTSQSFISCTISMCLNKFKIKIKEIKVIEEVSTFNKDGTWHFSLKDKFINRENLHVKSSATSASIHFPSPPWKDPSLATLYAARHAPYTSPPIHPLALTPTWLIPSAPLLTANLPTWFTDSNVRNVMLFTLEKQARCSWNINGHRSTWMIVNSDLSLIHMQSLQLSLQGMLICLHHSQTL